MNNEKLEQANAYLKKLWQESHAISEKEEDSPAPNEI